MSSKLPVGIIPPAILENKLRATFAKFGPVDTAETFGDPGTVVSQGFAARATALDEDAATAIGSPNFTLSADRKVSVS